LLPDICYLRLDFETFTTVGPTISTENGGTAAGTYTCPDQFKVTVSFTLEYCFQMHFAA
jgi:hypothetical protein